MPLRPYMKKKLCTQQRLKTNHRMAVGRATRAFTTGIVTTLASDRELISIAFGVGGATSSGFESPIELIPFVVLATDKAELDVDFGSVVLEDNSEDEGSFAPVERLEVWVLVAF